MLLRSLNPVACCVRQMARSYHLIRDSRVSQRHKLAFTLGDSGMGKITWREQPKQWQALATLSYV